MMAISGRCRFGGFSAAIAASRSSCAIAGGAATEVAGGSEKIQAPPITTKSATTPSALHNTRREFIICRLALIINRFRFYRRDDQSEMT
jgi:hypothetical protein